MTGKIAVRQNINAIMIGL